MIFDHRTYTCKAGTVGKHLALYEKHGWHLQEKHLGTPIVYATTDTGDVNSYVHIWVYKDAADRANRRAAMMADQEWLDYLKISAEAGYVLSQVTKILKPVSFVKQG